MLSLAGIRLPYRDSLAESPSMKKKMMNRSGKNTLLEVAVVPAVALPLPLLPPCKNHRLLLLVVSALRQRPELLVWQPKSWRNTVSKKVRALVGNSRASRLLYKLKRQAKEEVGLSTRRTLLLWLCLHHHRGLFRLLHLDQQPRRPQNPS